MTVHPFVDVESKEAFDGSGNEHPDAVWSTRPASEDEGSRPIPSWGLKSKGTGPALGALGNTIRRKTRYFGGKLLEYFGDYWVATKFGSLLTDGRKVRVKHLIAVANTAECYMVRPHDHFIKVDQHYLGAQNFIILLPSLEGVGVALGVPAECQSHTVRGSIADADVDRECWGRELFIESHGAKTADIIIRQGIDLVQAGYKWFQVGATNEWYLALDSGATPGVAAPTVVFLDRNLQTSGAIGALIAGRYAYGLAPSGLFSTIYIFSATNPNLRNICAGYGQVAKITNLHEKMHILAYYDELANDMRWNVIEQTVVTTSTTTTTTTTVTTSTSTTTTTTEQV